MAIDAARLREHLNASHDAASDTELTDCITTAADLLDRHLEDVPDGETVPAGIHDRAQLLVAAEVFNIGNSPNGYVNQSYDDGTAPAPVGISTDPLRPARRLLEQWVPPVTFG